MRKKTIKVRYSDMERVVMECPNCGKDVNVSRRVHYKCESFTGECWQCGWRFQIKDYEYDYIQPDSPFFEIIYRYHPEDVLKKQQKEKIWKEAQRKMKLGEKYDKDKNIKPWDKKVLKRVVLEEK